MKRLLTIAYILTAFAGKAQLVDTTKFISNTGSISYSGLKAKKALLPPTDTVYNKIEGSIAYINGVFYVKNSTAWTRILFNETDPSFLASAAYPITTTNTSNWNAAYSWGNHAGLYPVMQRFLDSINAVRVSVSQSNDTTYTIQQGALSTVIVAETDTTGWYQAATKDDIALLEKQYYSGTSGIAATSTNPGTPAGYRRYDVTAAGTYTNFLDGTSAAIVVSSGDLSSGQVYLVFDPTLGYWQKKIIPIDLTNYAQTKDTIISSNLFDPNATDVKLGYTVINSTGAEAINTGFSNLTGYIPVTANTNYTFNKLYRYAWYTSGKVYISGDIPNATTATTITAPANAAYIRVSVLLANWSTFQMNKGNYLLAYDVYAHHKAIFDSIYTYFPGDSVITQNKLKYRSVSVPKLSFTSYVTSANLFNPNASDVQLLYTLSTTDGTAFLNAPYTNTSGFIPVEHDSSYTFSKIYKVAWYNAAQQFIAPAITATSPTTLTAPSTAAYVRFAVLVADWPGFVIVKGTSLPASYVPYFDPYFVADNTFRVNALSDSLQASIPILPVPANQLSIMRIGKNLFNPNQSDVVYGATMNHLNGVIPEAGSNIYTNVSGKIPVTGGLDYAMTKSYKYVWYTSTDAYISGSNTQSSTPVVITAPANAAYLRVTLVLADWNSFMVEQSSSYTSFEAYLGEHGAIVDPAYLSETSNVTQTYVTTTGEPENFMKEILSSERQVFKLGIYGNSIYSTGLANLTYPWTDGTGQYEQPYGLNDRDGITRKVYDYLNYNKPTWRNCRHAAWSYTGTVSNVTSAVLPNTELLKLMNDGSSNNTAQITITGKESARFVFESGAIGQTEETGKVIITVSVNGGAFVNPSTIISGDLTNKGYGTVKIYAAAADTFNTAFTQIETVVSTNHYAPIKELVYNGLVAGNTYTFKITREAAEKPVRLWGAYYFTGQTLVVHNESKSGYSWTNLSSTLYGDFVVNKTDWVIMEAPMYHDRNLTTAQADAEAFIDKAKSYGIQLCLNSCPPGGVATAGLAGTVLGDENSSSYWAGMNFYNYFNRVRTVTTTSISTSGETPKLHDIYSVDIDGTTYNIESAVGNTTTSLNLMFPDDFPLSPTFPLTLTKVSGDAGSLSTIVLLSQGSFFTMEQHREMIKKVCDIKNIKFIDVFQAFADLAKSVGETLATEGYNMDVNDPLYAAMVTADADNSNYPTLSTPYKKNYMTNFFSPYDGHHMTYPAAAVITDLWKRLIFINCSFKN